MQDMILHKTTPQLLNMCQPKNLDQTSEKTPHTAICALLAQSSVETVMTYILKRNMTRDQQLTTEQSMGLVQQPTDLTGE